MACRVLAALDCRKMCLNLIRVGGEAIRFVSQYKYLGILHHDTLHWRADFSVRHAKAQHALGVMQSCLASLSATKKEGSGLPHA